MSLRPVRRSFQNPVNLASPRPGSGYCAGFSASSMAVSEIAVCAWAIFSDSPFSFSPQIIRGKRAIPMPSTAA
jgi:hypothetical protein